MAYRCRECGAYPLDEDDTAVCSGLIYCLDCADVEEEEEVKTIKARFSLSIGYVGATKTETVEFDVSDFDDCETDEERENRLGEFWDDWASNYIGSSVSYSQ